MRRRSTRLRKNNQKVRENNIAIEEEEKKTPVSSKKPAKVARSNTKSNRLAKFIRLINKYNNVSEINLDEFEKDIDKVQKTGKRSESTKFKQVLLNTLQEESNANILKLWGLRDKILNIYTILYPKPSTVLAHYKVFNKIMKTKDIKEPGNDKRIAMFLIDSNDKTKVDIEQGDNLEFRRNNPIELYYDDIIRVLKVLDKKNDVLANVCFVILTTACRVAEVLHVSTFINNKGKLKQINIAKKGGEGRIVHDRMFYHTTAKEIVDKVKIVQDEVLRKYPITSKTDLSERSKKITNTYAKTLNRYVKQLFYDNNVIIKGETKGRNELSSKSLRTIGGNMMWIIKKNGKGSVVAFLSKALAHENKASALNYEEVKILGGRVDKPTQIAFAEAKELKQQVETNKTHLKTLLKDKKALDKTEKGKLSIADILLMSNLKSNSGRTPDAKAKRIQRLKLLITTLQNNGHTTPDRLLKRWSYGSAIIREVKREM